MNYRHAYHAGNHADVFKHLVLARIFALLGRKDTPYAYLDSHSGVGLYDLQGDEASRTGEWEQGIARLWEREGLPEQLDDYLDVIRHLNPDGSLRYYPGSPEKRAVLLIDPPFEQADELQRCVAALDEAIGRMRQTVVVIWYPIKDERQLKRFYQALERSVAPKLLRAELHVHPIDDAERFNGSGLAIVNPPWPLEDELRDLLPWLAEVMAQSQGGWRLDWLVAE